MLRVEKISKSFSKGTVKAVRSVSFELKKGGCVGLVGPNGAGKTTLIQSICTILNPDSGGVWVGGHDIYNDPVEAKKLIAYIPEVPNPFEYLTVWEHIEFSAKAYYREDWERDAQRHLERFNLTEKKFALVHTLSKGQKQKMQIICAFVHNPKMVFMDEPLIGIDPEGAHAMKKLIREFREKGSTFLISSHMLSLIDELCSSVLVMQKGRLVWQGSIEEIKKKQNTGDLEEAFIEITRESRSQVEDAFEEGQSARPSIMNLFAKGRRRK